MTKRRVVVTGIGAISPVGNSAEDSWNAVINGQSGIGMLTRLDSEQFPVKVAAEVKDFDIEEYIDKKDARKMDRFTHYALAASIMAMKDAGLEELNEELALRTGVWIGSGIGGWKHMNNSLRFFKKEAIAV